MSKINDPGALPGKISLGTDGLGTVTPEMVEERALKLAKADGRHEANEKDLREASEELLGRSSSGAPEEEDVERLTEWDTPPDSAGGAAPKVSMEDEANVAEQLVEEGIDEADHASRVAAAEDLPPEEV